MLKIDISSNIYAMPEYLDDVSGKVVIQAAKTAINKTLKQLQTFSVKQVGLNYKLRSSGLSASYIKNKLIKIHKASGADISRLSGAIVYRGTKIPILDFVTGHKNVIKQKGIKISKRRKLTAEIVPGKKTALKHAFIQQINSKQVFKRGRGRRAKKQAVAGIGIVLFREINKAALHGFIIKKFPGIFKNQVDFRMGKLNAKLAKARLKIHGVQ
jgi:ethanolamine utilization microcompartment shell protein EutS